VKPDFLESAGPNFRSKRSGYLLAAEADSNRWQIRAQTCRKQLTLREKKGIGFAFVNPEWGSKNNQQIGSERIERLQIVYPYVKIRNLIARAAQYRPEGAQILKVDMPYGNCRFHT
jgi:hypothetical protein